MIYIIRPFTLTLTPTISNLTDRPFLQDLDSRASSSKEDPRPDKANGLGWTGLTDSLLSLSVELIQ